MSAGARETTRPEDLLVATTGLAVIAAVLSVVMSVRSDPQLLAGTGALLAVAGLRATGLWIGFRILLVIAAALVIGGGIYRRATLGF